MKKIVSVILALIMLFSVVQLSLTSYAQDAQKPPIIFVTGIGQTFSHIRAKSDEDADYFYPYKTITYDEEKNKTTEIEYVPCTGDLNGKGTNLFILDFGKTLTNFLKSPIKLFRALWGIGQLLESIFTGEYTIDDENFATILKEVLCLMTVDEDGNLPEEVFVPFYDYPVSEYVYYYNITPDKDGKNKPRPDESEFSENRAVETEKTNERNVYFNGDYKGKVVSQSPKERFYSMVGDSEEVKAYGEDRIFCFNYAPYGSIEKLTNDLYDYIEHVQENYCTDSDQKVILVPMSMGATVVSNYLYKYGDEADVEKVVSIVGCWQGSDLFADLIEGRYAENSPEIFYTQMWPGICEGDGWGSLVNILLHCMSKETLTPFFKKAAELASKEFILKTPSMLGLIPPERYDDIRKKYLTETDSDVAKPGYEVALEEADAYHKAQVAVKDTMTKLNEEQGVEFYFVAGYGLGFGEITSTYSMFRCFESSPVTNSDEIIQISSTTVGATSVTPGSEFSDEDLNGAEKNENGEYVYITPDKTVDLSTAMFPDHCFLFKGQKHELENNQVAISIAVKLAELPNPDTDINGDGVVDEKDVQLYTTQLNAIPRFNTEVENELPKVNEDDQEMAEITKPINTFIYVFTGPQGIPDLFKKK